MLNIFQQIIEETKIREFQSLFENYSGSLAEQLGERDQFRQSVQMYLHEQLSFKEVEVRIASNCLIREGNKYIVLSKANYELKYQKQKPSEWYLILLTTNTSKEVLAFTSEAQFNKVHAMVKRYCISKDFNERYFLIEDQGCLAAAQSKKHTGAHTVIIAEATDTVHNAISIYHSLQVQPQVQKVFQLQDKFYLVCAPVRLQSLGSLLKAGFDLKEVQLVSITFMILQTLQKYTMRGIYHGNINMNTVFFNLQSPVLQITLLNPQYSTTVKKTIADDLHDVGLLLYQLTFYKSQYVEEQINRHLIQNCKQQMQNFNHQIQEFRFLYRVSQLDLLEQLINYQIKLDAALRHHWFVTIKQNLKQRTSIHKESLMTIVEQNEQSLSQSYLQDPMGLPQQFTHQFTLDYEEPEDENPDKPDLQDSAFMIPSKSSHDNILKLMNQKSKTLSTMQSKRFSLLELQKQSTFK